MKKLVCTLLLLSSAFVQAGFDEGMAAYQNGDYKAAFKEFKLLAEQGDSAAQFNLALMYANGLGVRQNYTQAVHWNQNAAAQGNIAAQYNLGYFYANGRGVPRNYTQAVYWYKKAAEQGHAAAQFNLALMYNDGQGVPQNYTQAVHWYKKAAEQGLAGAQGNLGVRYAYGQGVPQNYKIAYILLNLAASNGSNDTKNRNIALTKLSPAAVADAQRITLQLHNSKNFAADLRKLLNSQK